MVVVHELSTKRKTRELARVPLTKGIRMLNSRTARVRRRGGGEGAHVYTREGDIGVSD